MVSSTYTKVGWRLVVGKIAKFLLAATAFSPILLTYAAMSVLDGDWHYAIVFLATCIILVLVCVGLLSFMKAQLEPTRYSPATVEIADNEVLGLLLIYLVPLVTSELSTVNWHAWLLVGSAFCLIASTSYGYHFNPLLVIFGWHFYKITEKRGIPFVLITRRRIYSVEDGLEVGWLAEYVLIEKRTPEQIKRDAGSSK